MKICPITYEVIDDNQHYSIRGLKMLSPKLVNLNPLPFTASELRIEAAKHASKMSIQGIQPKLSCVLSIKNEAFMIVDTGGRYILKPEHDAYPEVPQNEDLSMRLAAMIGIEVPFHGMVYGADNRLTYFIKRFDRFGQADKLSVEDFSQLSQHTRTTKYNFSMEKIIQIVDEYATFPLIEKTKLFTRTIFNFLIGNEDMHLKNFSMIIRNQRVELSPAYDFLNSSIIISSKEEIALPLAGKINNLSRKDLVDYFGLDRMNIPKKIIDSQLTTIEKKIPAWKTLIDASFLSETMKQQYHDILDERVHRLW